MNDSKLSKNDDTTIDELKKIIDHLTILSTKINTSLLEFEKKLNLDDKKNVLNKLNSLLIQFTDIFKLANNQYLISPQDIQNLNNFFIYIKLIVKILLKKEIYIIY